MAKLSREVQFDWVRSRSWLRFREGLCLVGGGGGARGSHPTQQLCSCVVSFGHYICNISISCEFHFVIFVFIMFMFAIYVMVMLTNAIGAFVKDSKEEIIVKFYVKKNYLLKFQCVNTRFLDKITF